MDRRSFMQRAAGFVAAASAERLGAQVPTALGVKTVRTNVLEIGYHESGDADGFPVVLLHGFPDDAHAYDGVMPALANAGLRAFAVYLRGYGPTRFLDPMGARTAEQAKTNAKATIFEIVGVAEPISSKSIDIAVVMLTRD